MNNRQRWRNLAHVFWVGGSPCAGKSAVVDLLASWYDVQVYRCDDEFGRHIRLAAPEAHPTLHSVTRMTWDEIWMRPVEAQVTDEIRAYHEQFPMIVEDLLKLPVHPPIIADGSALLPYLVAERLVYHWQAVWMVPSEAFQRRMYPQRGAWVREILSHCTEPDVAFENWMERDKRFGDWVFEQATSLEYPVIEVDGAHTIEETARLVERHFRWNIPPEDGWVSLE